MKSQKKLNYVCTGGGWGKEIKRPRWPQGRMGADEKQGLGRWTYSRAWLQTVPSY